MQLELGGKNPAVVLDHGSRRRRAGDRAAAFQCSGQRCTAISRVIVGDDRPTLWLSGSRPRSRIKVGDGLDPGTTMGPLVSQNQLRSVDGYVRQGVRLRMRPADRRRSLTETPEREGYLLCAHSVRPGPARLSARGRGNLRPGAADSAGAGLGRGDQHREQHALRSGGIAVHVTAGLTCRNLPAGCRRA